MTSLSISSCWRVQVPRQREGRHQCVCSLASPRPADATSRTQLQGSRAARRLTATQQPRCTIFTSGGGDKVRLDVSTLRSAEAYALVCSAILPRPIALVSTQSEDGCLNLAPLSFFMPVSSQPCTLAFSLTFRRDGSPKDSLLNIRSQKQFCVNHVTRDIFRQVYQAGTEFPRDVDEFAETGLTPQKAVLVTAPLVKEAAVSLECELMSLNEVGGAHHGGATVVLGKVVYAHIARGAYDPAEIVNAQSISTVSRLGGMSYGTAKEDFEVWSDGVWSKEHW